MTKAEINRFKNKLTLKLFLNIVLVQTFFVSLVVFVDLISGVQTNLLIAIEILFSIIVTFIFSKNFINKITEQLERENKEVKEFMTNAAHELKTPLTIVHTNLELAEKTKNYDKYLKQAKNEIVESKVFIDKLLQLAAIKNTKETNVHNLEELVDEVLSSFNKSLEEKNLTVGKTINNTKIKGDEILILLLLNNIIENAIKYSLENTRITIQIEENSLIVTNKSQKIKDISKLNNRFYKENSSHSGHGVGLSIVDQVARMHKWKTNYSYENEHFKFVLNF